MSKKPKLVSVRWNTGYLPNDICRKIDETKQRDSQGNVSFRGFVLYQLMPLLVDALDLGDSVDAQDKSTLLHDVVFKVAKSGNVTKDRVQAETSRAVNQLVLSLSESTC